MRISDWSSDVCSSDLRGGTATLKSSAPSATATAWFARPPRGSTPTTKTFEKGRKHEDYRKNSSRGPAPARHPVHRADQQRSEERCVGHECVSTFRSRWSSSH